MNKNIVKRLQIGLIAIALIIGCIPIYSSNVNAQAKECDTVYYAANDILYYNPCETCSNNSSQLMGKNNEEKIYKWFISKGFNAAQAAGMMGNMAVESPNYNPFRMQTTYSSQGIEAVLPVDDHKEYMKAFGLVQWDGGRRQQVLGQISVKFTDYITLINTYGKSADGYLDAPAEKNDSFLAFELEFLEQELSKGYTHVYDAIKSQPNTVEGVENAAEIWNRKYEVSADYSKDRHNIGKELFAKYKDATVTAGSSSEGETDCGNEPAGEIVWYSQCDPRWGKIGYAGGTICEVGCGPSSMAIILASLIDKNITPEDVAAVAGDQNGGTSWQPLINGVNQKWNVGISGKPLSVDEAMEFVKSGKGYVWIGGTGEAPFTKNGHMVAMVGVTSDGKITIADPFGEGNGRQKIGNYTVAEIESQTGTGLFGVPKK